MNEHAVAEELLRIKAAAVEATRNRDTQFYASYLADDTVCVTPRGVFAKADVLKAISEGSLRSTKIEDERARVLDERIGMVAYVATFAGAQGPWRAYVTTLYRRTRDRWEGFFYQQTPLP